jgi:hypothetical protein
MLKNMDMDELRCAMRLETNEDWNCIRRYLEKQLRVLDENNRFGEGTQLHRQQGAAQTIESLLLQMRSARDLIKSMTR